MIVDYGLDAIIGREFRKRKLERIPIAEAQSDETAGGRATRRSGAMKRSNFTTREGLVMLLAGALVLS